MIGIKGMELPKSCNNCRFCVIATTVNDLGMLCGVNTDIDTVCGFTSSRHPNCPLVDLGKEDMSWKELIEKIKNIKFVCLGRNKKWFYIAFGGYAIEFHNDGTIFLSCEHSFNLFENKKPFEMWQIIKALVGGEK